MQKRKSFEPGQKVGRLTLLYLTERGRHPRWAVRCDCGTEKTARAGHMYQGRIVSCGCWRIEDKTIHGKCKTPEHSIWSKMISRVKPDAPDNHIYASRGIVVCSRWVDGEGGLSGFECFLSDMGERPSPAHSIDRFPDNAGNYEPSNCRWATPGEQARNRRQNIFVMVGDKKLCLLDAVAVLCPDLGYPCVLDRIYKGWPIERAMSEPKMPGRPLKSRA